MKHFKNPLHISLISGLVLLYVTFLAQDIFSAVNIIPAIYLKYASIMLCFLLAFSLYTKSSDKKDSKYVVLALLLTLIADIFLIFTSHYSAGVFFFCLVQLTYLKRHNTRFFMTGLQFIPVAALAYFFMPLDFLYIIAGLYGALILTCFISSFKTTLPKFNKMAIRIGLILFILCDIHVALFNLLPRSHNYFAIAAVAMWFFYLPSQVMLAFSAGHFKKTA